MQEFGTLSELTTAIGLRDDTGDGFVHGFDRESDWTYRGSGHGLQGFQAQSRWLVTFAVPAGHDEGYLIAYAVEGVWNDAYEFVYRESGRCLLLGGPWSESQDRALYAAAKQQPWWFQDAAAPGPAIEEIANWLQTAIA
ncbi:MAG: hypothetical protein JWN95_232 [Frankiales bacterium]|nr:hypothetical protein [Frankiales bacterium]